MTEGTFDLESSTEEFWAIIAAAKAELQREMANRLDLQPGPEVFDELDETLLHFIEHQVNEAALRRKGKG
jgi:hypothetical protein